MLDDEIGRAMRDVQIDAVAAEPLHLVVDGAGDDVARRQFGALVEARHEALAIGQQQAGALAAQRLGDQEGARLRVDRGRSDGTA